MEQPYAAENDPSDGDAFHHYKADRHKYRDRYHYFYLGFPCHTLSFYVAFKIVFVELCVYEPAVQPFRAFCKAYGGEQKKRKCGEKRQDCTDCAESNSKAARSYQKYLFYIHHFSFQISFIKHMADRCYRVIKHHSGT